MHTKIKYSAGVACFRRHEGQIQILLVCKKYTYAYNLFIHGMYRNDAQLIKLFNGMTIDEKLDILSGNFNVMWNRVWFAETVNFIKYRKKYLGLTAADNGKKLQNMLKNTANVSRMWEIPKGRKINIYENDIICAMREFEEETGIRPDDYKLLPGLFREERKIDGQIVYISRYYYAQAVNDFEPNLLNKQIINEICDIKWMNLNEIKLLCSQLESTIRPMIKFIKRRFKRENV